MVLGPAEGVALLEEVIQLANDGSPIDFNHWRTRSRMALRLAMGEGHPLLAEFEAIKYQPSAGIVGRPVSPDFRRGRIRQATVVLRNAQDEIKLLRGEAYVSATGDDGPPALQIDFEALHPVVIQAARDLLRDGHVRSAAEAASRAVEQQLRTKLQAQGGTAVQLASAFSTQDPKPKESRLRFPEFGHGTDSWVNAHEGAMFFAKGCFMRLRNLYTHHVEPDPQEALEALAAFSIVARWVDEAVLEKFVEGAA